MQACIHIGEVVPRQSVHQQGRQRAGLQARMGKAGAAVWSARSRESGRGRVEGLRGGRYVHGGVAT
eukprot:scaffold34347_cov118-Isochrysis_galbana.AAC.5